VICAKAFLPERVQRVVPHDVVADGADHHHAVAAERARGRHRLVATLAALVLNEHATGDGLSR
jgi:hypothetical protein